MIIMKENKRNETFIVIIPRWKIARKREGIKEIDPQGIKSLRKESRKDLSEA